jgi:MarR family
LADAVVLSRSGLSRLVDRLEAAGLLRRAAVAGDRRGAYAEITGDGVRVLRRMWPVYSRCVAEHFVPSSARMEPRSAERWKGSRPRSASGNLRPADSGIEWFNCAEMLPPASISESSQPL